MVDTQQSKTKREKEGFRTSKLLREKRRRAHLIRLFLGTGLLSLILVAAVNLLVARVGKEPFVSFHFEKPQGNNSAKISSKKVPNAKKTFLIIGLAKDSASKEASGFILTVYDSKKRQVNAISFNPNTLVEIPGYGFEKVSESLIPGVPVSIATISNLVGVRIKHHVILTYADFKAPKDPTFFSEIFDKTVETDYSQREKVEFQERIADLKKSDMNVIPLPVYSAAVVRKIYYKPKEAEMNRLIRILWEDSSELQRSKRPRLAILNGSGVPGVVGDASRRLINSGFKVISTGNAERFDYKETMVIIYGDRISLAKKIEKTIGVKKVISQRKSQKIVDATIIVGKDYKTGEEQDSGL